MNTVLKPKVLLFTVILCLIALMGNACAFQDRGIKGNGNVVTQTRTVSGFTKLSVSSAFKVFVKQGSATELKVEAEENLMDHIITKVEGSTLRIYCNGVSATKNMTIHLTFVNLDEIKLSGAVAIESVSALKFEKLYLDFSGATEANLDLTANELDGDASGATKLKLAGSVSKVDFDLSGASELEAKGLSVKTMELEASGASSAEVDVAESLNISASGASDVRYSGAAQVQSKSSGASNIRKR